MGLLKASHFRKQYHILSWTGF